MSDQSKQGHDLTAREVAAELGIAYDTVRRLIQRGDLRAYNVNLRHLRVTREALDEFKRAGGAKPQGRPHKEQE